MLYQLYGPAIFNTITCFVDALVQLTSDIKPLGIETIGISSNSVTTHPQDGPNKLAEDAQSFGAPLLIAALPLAQLELFLQSQQYANQSAVLLTSRMLAVGGSTSSHSHSHLSRPERP